MEWVFVAAFLALVLVFVGSLWLVSPAYYVVALVLATALAAGGAYYWFREAGGADRYFSIAFILFFYGFAVYVLGQKHHMNEKVSELTTPGQFAAFVKKLPAATKYQRFLAALPMVLLVYFIALVIGLAIVSR